MVIERWLRLEMDEKMDSKDSNKNKYPIYTLTRRMLYNESRHRLGWRGRRAAVIQRLVMSSAEETLIDSPNYTPHYQHAKAVFFP